ncbi:MAG: alpha-L-fucosidase [Oscillospiraceae bacterium]|nr:alpha-L-fucosidase [Oscillospiraceae bacterium]
MDKVKAYLKQIDEVIAQGPYTDSWESLCRHTLPKWYHDAKFGIFIHWGVFSVPAFCDEWYPRRMYQPGNSCYDHHIATYGPHKEFGYKDFIPMFRAEKFDADAWAELFDKAGARFVMPVAEHHDGFQMYDSDLSDWCAAKMGPKKDILGQLKQAFEKKNLTLTASSHRIEHYWFMSGGKDFDSDMPQQVPYGDLYWPSVKEPEQGTGAISGFEVDPDYMDDWLARTCELVDKYRPKIMYFDWWIEIEPMKPYLRKFAAYYYNRAAQWGEEVTINYKYDAFAYGSATRDIERGQLSDISADFWQNDTSVARNSWCYTVGNDYKEPGSIIADLVDVVSKNGSLLLNIGPKSDGTIPDEDAHILLEIGKWLSVNGEGIYGTDHWKKCGEGPTQVPEGHFTDTLRKSFTTEDFRFTYKPGTLYVFAMQWPEDGVVRIRTLGRDARQFNGVIRKAEILGHDGPVKQVLCSDYLTIMADGISTPYPVCIKLTLD